MTVALKHKIMTRRIAQQLGEVQYMLKQGSNWHDITDYYRARKKAVKLKAETWIFGLAYAIRPVTWCKGYKYNKKSHRKRKRFKWNLLKFERPYCM